MAKLSQVQPASVTEAIPKTMESKSTPAQTLNQEARIPSPYDRPYQPLPWVTAKDVLWALYLYPGRLLSRIPTLVHLLLNIAEPVVQMLSAPRKDELMQRFAAALGSEKPSSVFDDIARKYIANDIRRVGDDLLLERTNANVRCISFRGREHLDGALAAGKGVLLVGLHWFAERAAMRFLTETGYPVMSVRHQEPPDQYMGRLGRRFFQPKYIRFLHTVIRDEVFLGDRECALKILGRLRCGGIVSILLDAPFSQQLVELPFLGQTRNIPTGALHLTRISGCTVLPMLALGHAQALKILIERPLTFDRSLPNEEFCQAYLPPLIRIMESHVRKHPDQWDCWTKPWK
jgi:lauroyl/myristoyl acyltransferase